MGISARIACEMGIFRQLTARYSSRPSDLSGVCQHGDCLTRSLAFVDIQRQVELLGCLVWLHQWMHLHIPETSTLVQVRNRIRHGCQARAVTLAHGVERQMLLDFLRGKDPCPLGPKMPQP